MDSTETFARALARDGFEPPVTVTREAHGKLDDHTHPFEAKALILAGEIRIVTEGSDRVYGVGDVFHLQAHEPHSEFYGPAGVNYLVGRKPALP
ncbi:cupin domain-containing protein [Acidovorax sp. sic0104]|uniref:cupin domain-containing protein n=1 Tax=Acidovorax sp. sic0104 TaxID=2854784 RepID=UPI001C465AAB|nr:cupin [Acidovorax sp. sic0104]MBV7542933.1 cupin [Acidovorax sp. sic0104]